MFGPRGIADGPIPQTMPAKPQHPLPRALGGSVFSAPTRALAATAILALAGCTTVGPDYTPPLSVAPAQWAAAIPHAGNFARLADWWGQFHDPVLSGLLDQAEKTSPTLAAATARIAESRAALTVSESKRAPAVNGSGRMTRAGANGDVPTATQDTAALAIDASWEVDLFGRVRRVTEAAEARLGAKQFEWHAARISVAAEVADTYVGYRACQQLVAVSERDVISRASTSDLVGRLVEAGFRAPVEGETTAASLADAQTDLVGQRAQCDLFVKALVALTGLPERELRARLGRRASLDLPVPETFAVDTIPVKVLAQRPDLAAAERGLAAATADVGAAEANRYPRLSLSGSVSLSLASVASTVVSQPWSFGPSLTLPLFDAGQRRAEVVAAEARLAQQRANFEGAVRQAAAEVERALVMLDSSRMQETSARAAAAGYARVQVSTEILFSAGGASLLVLEDARRSANGSERKLLTLQRERVRAWISLYKAVGGGWSASTGDDQ